LFAGRLDPVKRPLLVARIAAELHKRRANNYRFLVAGDGPEGGAMKALVRKLGITEMFDFLGHIEDVESVLRRCELVILTSEAEGIPLIVLEAFACGRTAVASAVGGVREVVTPETGVAIPPGRDEIRRFADAIEELTARPEVRDSLARNGRVLVERLFDRRRFFQEYREVFA
jgi:glycosyltransferase involved in cell wall biosynthesis